MTRKKLVLMIFSAVVMLLFGIRYWIKVKGTPEEKNAPASYERIISLAPSITEILFSLGAGDRVIGVTEYCKYPPEAQNRSKIGAYLNPNYEAIASLTPDLVIMLTEHEEQKKYCEKLSLAVLQVDHKNIQGILKSIQTVGDRINSSEAAAKIVSGMRDRMEAIEKKVAGLNRPKLMISIGRNMGTGTLKDVYIVGKDGFYEPMIRIAGGENAYSTGNIKYPTVSGEGIMQIDPEIIVDMVADLKEAGLTVGQVIDEWKTLDRVRAVKTNRVYVFDDSFVVIPGPRFVNIIEKLAAILHPEVE